MATLSPSQIYTLLLQGGFSPDKARLMTAIAQAESARNPGAIGDVALQNGTWGPSVGLFQVRTLKAETGDGQRPRHPAPAQQPRRAGRGGPEDLERRQQPPPVEHLHQRRVPEISQ